MKYLQYTPYLYLILAILFVFDGISKFSEPNGTYWISFLLAAVGIFMFFFRRNFAKKFDDRSKRQQ